MICKQLRAQGKYNTPPYQALKRPMISATGDGDENVVVTIDAKIDARTDARASGEVYRDLNEGITGRQGFAIVQ